MPHRVERSEDKWGFLRMWEPCRFERFQRADLSLWRLEDLRRVHIWCGDGSMLGASAGLSCELPSSGWWYFPTSDVLYAFYQLFYPAHVGFMDLHLSFLWCLPGIAFPGSRLFRMLSRGLLILFPSSSMSTVEQCWPLLDLPSCWRWKMWAFPLLTTFFFFKL